MSWLKDLLGANLFAGKDIVSSVFENPLQTLAGANTPIAAKAFNTVLGTNFTPQVNDFGGVTDATWNRADAAGINTSGARTAGKIADTVAGIWGGMGAASALGGIGANAGAGLNGLDAATVYGPGSGWGATEAAWNSALLSPEMAGLSGASAADIGLMGDVGMGAGGSAVPSAGTGGADVLGTWSNWSFDPSQLMGSLGSGGGAGSSFIPSTTKDWLSIGSGLYGMYQSEQQRKLAKQAVAGSSPWTASGGTAMAGEELKRAISGNLSEDAGFKLAQNAAARTSAQQPGGFASMAAANAALKYQNDRINTLGGPAGVGFNPATGYATGLQGQQMANSLASSSLGSIGYGMGGSQMPPWLQAYLIQQGMGGKP